MRFSFSRAKPALPLGWLDYPEAEALLGPGELDLSSRTRCPLSPVGLGAFGLLTDWADRRAAARQSRPRDHPLALAMDMLCMDLCRAALGWRGEQLPKASRLIGLQMELRAAVKQKRASQQALSLWYAVMEWCQEGEREGKRFIYHLSEEELFEQVERLCQGLLAWGELHGLYELSCEAEIALCSLRTAA